MPFKTLTSFIKLHQSIAKHQIIEINKKKEKVEKRINRNAKGIYVRIFCWHWKTNA